MSKPTNNQAPDSVELKGQVQRIFELLYAQKGKIIAGSCSKDTLYEFADAIAAHTQAAIDTAVREAEANLQDLRLLTDALQNPTKEKS